MCQVSCRSATTRRVTSHVSRIENLLGQLRKRIRDFETGIIDLKSGHLPSHLVGYNELTKTLTTVQRRLPAGFRLGIPNDRAEQREASIPLETGPAEITGLCTPAGVANQTGSRRNSPDRSEPPEAAPEARNTNTEKQSSEPETDSAPQTTRKSPRKRRPVKRWGYNQLGGRKQ